MLLREGHQAWLFRFSQAGLHGPDSHQGLHSRSSRQCPCDSCTPPGTQTLHRAVFPPTSASPAPTPSSEPERAFRERRQILQAHYEPSDASPSSGSDLDLSGPVLNAAGLDVPPRARPIDSSDDDMDHSIEPPRFARSHATYGDAEFFCRKVDRVPKSGKYAAYPLPAQIAQIATYCDDATASRLDRLVEERV